MEIKSIQIREQSFSVEIAVSEYETTIGLSKRKVLNKNSGMLFVLSQPQRIPIWMKDMHLAIDIIWINEDWQIVHIEPNVLPETISPYNEKYPDVLARYVLEISA